MASIKLSKLLKHDSMELKRREEAGAGSGPVDACIQKALRKIVTINGEPTASVITRRGRMYDELRVLRYAVECARELEAIEAEVRTRLTFKRLRVALAIQEASALLAGCNSNSSRYAHP